MKQIITDVGKLIYREVADPVPKEGEVLIEVKSVGICQSDIEPYKGKHLDVLHLPFVQGHEFGGIIKNINGISDKFKVGDKVSIFPQLFCGHCYYCINGIEHMCDNSVLFGSAKKEGAMSEFIAIPLKNLVKMDDTFDIRHAGLVEPATVAYHTVSRFKNDNVAIIGAGSIGIMMGQILKHNGCKFIAIDIEDNALKLAKELGADFAININDGDKIEKIKDFLKGGHIDGIVITFLNKDNLDFALDLVRKEGIVIEMASPVDLLLDTHKLFFKAINLKGSLSYNFDEFVNAASLIEKGIIDAEKIITKIYPFSQAKDAFEFKAKTATLKVIITED